MLPQLLVDQVPMKWRNHVIYLVQVKLLQMFYMWLDEKDIFFTLKIGKKVCSFWGIDCETLNDQLSGTEHKQNILMSVFSCIYIKFENSMCIVLCIDGFFLKFMPRWDLVFWNPIFSPSPFQYRALTFSVFICPWHKVKPLNHGRGTYRNGGNGYWIRPIRGLTVLWQACFFFTAGGIKEGKVCKSDQAVHQAGAQFISDFSSIRRQAVFLLVQRIFTPSIKFAGTHLYP